MRPRKICYFAGTAGNWGGASRVLFTNLRLLDRARFSPIVLLSGHGPAEALLQSLDIPFEVWGPLTEPGRSMGQLRDYPLAVLRAFLWLRRQGVELVHMNRANDWRPAEILAMRLARIPVVTHFHTVNVDHAPATRWSAAIAAVSNYVARHADTRGIPATVIHNAVDLSRFTSGRSLRGTLGIGPDDVVVSFVGQIKKIKGAEDFIAMARRINSDHVRFLISGQCWGDKAAGSYTQEELLGLIACDPRISYCGYVDQIEDIYRTSDIIVAPSRWQEPFGLVCIEAGVAGLPLVATRVGGIPEIIEDGVNGMLVEAGDVAALAERVQRLVDAPALRDKLGKAARLRVERDFTDKPVRTLEALYEALLSS
ncbi:MAG: glycosyltransferase family 4 protein [Gammaproteobacteria bacterium]|nr:glycosyltransferase family 4 protein [Gammaproteobacteria bacterium]